MDDFIYYDIKFYTIPIIALKTKHKKINDTIIPSI